MRLRLLRPSTRDRESATWWWRMPTPSRVFFLIASAVFVADVALLILAQTERIGFRLPAEIASGFVVLIWIGLFIVGRMNRRREMDDIVQRVREEDEESGGR
jgi:hypothetical protein